MAIVWENMVPSTELPLDFCVRIGPLQLGVVLVCLCFPIYIWAEVAHCSSVSCSSNVHFFIYIHNMFLYSLVPVLAGIYIRQSHYGYPYRDDSGGGGDCCGRKASEMSDCGY